MAPILNAILPSPSSPLTHPALPALTKRYTTPQTSTSNVAPAIIAVIVIGVIFVMLIAACCCICGTRKRMTDTRRDLVSETHPGGRVARTAARPTANRDNRPPVWRPREEPQEGDEELPTFEQAVKGGDAVVQAPPPAYMPDGGAAELSGEGGGHHHAGGAHDGGAHGVGSDGGRGHGHHGV